MNRVTIELHASVDSITFVKRLIPLRSIRIPVDTFPSRKLSLRKMQRLYPGISYVPVSRLWLFTKDTPSSISDDTFPFTTSLYISLFHLLPKSFLLARLPSPSRYRGKLKITSLFLSSSFAIGKQVASPRFFRCIMLFIIARWYPARETALCCSTSLPARSCYRNPPLDRSAHHRRRPPPPASPPRPYVCLDASHRPCRRPSFSSSRGFYSGERIAVVICIWKSTRTGALWSVSVLLSISRGSSSPYV